MYLKTKYFYLFKKKVKKSPQKTIKAKKNSYQAKQNKIAFNLDPNKINSLISKTPQILLQLIM